MSGDVISKLEEQNVMVACKCVALFFQGNSDDQSQQL